MCHLDLKILHGPKNKLALPWDEAFVRNWSASRAPD